MPTTAEDPTPAAPASPPRARVLRDRFAAQWGLLGQAARGLLDAVLSYLLVVLVVGALVLAALRVGLPLLGRVAALVRRHSDRRRRWAGRILGRPVDSPGLPGPGLGGQLPATAVLRDGGVRRDVTWLVLDSTAGLAACWLHTALWVGAMWYLVLPLVWAVVPSTRDWQTLGALDGSGPVGYLAVPLVGVAQLLVVLWIAEPLTRARARLARTWLEPEPKAKLSQRVEDLTRSRADSLDLQASEIRRIERDLHDGAQARLVAMGLNLGLAESLLRDDPDAARDLLQEARQNNLLALSELRDLVHGIHPPVLADRGLDGAVRALAIDCPLPVDVEVTLPGRAPAPVESAIYFAVAECLTNVAKHASARRAWIRIDYHDGRLGAVVGDDGVGGADPHGAGLHGLQRRLAAFDAALTVTSPPGGPTLVTMELPCGLS